MRGVKSKRVQCDEIWSFVYAKAKNVRDREGCPGRRRRHLDVDGDSTPTRKLMIAWLVGNRDAGNANVFMQDVANRLANRVQLTTDGHKPYLQAVESAFGVDIDYAKLVKHYGDADGAQAATAPANASAPRRRRVDGTPGSDARLHVIRRAPEPHHADEHAPASPG